VPGKRTSPRRHRPAGILTVVSAGLVTAACAAGGSPAGARAASSSPSAARSASPAASPSPTPYTGPVAPLTGLPASAADAARRAVALVIAGHRPRGLSAADVIFEEISTPRRYIAVFQSRRCGAVGPITSTQPADGQLLSVLRPRIGYDGGTPGFIKILDNTQVTDRGYPAYTSPYTIRGSALTASTSKLRGSARGSAPPQIFSYRGTSSGATQLAAAGESRPSSVTVSIPGHGRRKWTFDARTDRWAQVSGGPPIQVANLIVQFVRFKEVFLNRRDGITVPSARVFGRGKADVFSGIGNTPDHGAGGLAARGTWSKPGLRSVTDYFDSKGLPMELQPGTTWIILAPRGTRVRAS
jgi:hypothetical protein